MTGAHLKEMVMMAYMDCLEASNYEKNTKITQKHLEASRKILSTNRAKYNHYKPQKEADLNFHQ
jgi:hypothetical protein